MTQATAENRSREQAKSQLDSIEQWHRIWTWAEDADAEAKDLPWVDRQYIVRDLGWNEDTDPGHIRDCIQQLVEEDPLSLEVRSGWTSAGETLEPEEFSILLCTGGPAVRLRGTLSSGSVDRCWIEHQDWFTPWQELNTPGASDALVWYADHFYVGE